MGWTNATQSSDIESLLRRPNLQQYRSRVRIETPPRLGRGDRILLPSVIPAQVQGRHLHNEKYTYDWVSAPRPTPPDASWDHVGDTTHFGRNELKKKDYGRTAQSDVTHLLELTESFIRYMISMSEETDKNNTKGNIKNEEDSKSSSSENDKN